MSIVIAKIEGKNCSFFADTKVSVLSEDSSVSGVNKLRLPPEHGVLKIHVVSSKIIIGFAGTVELCTSIIESFIQTKPGTLPLILEYFKSSLNENEDNSEFIIGIFIGDEPTLFKISRYNIENGKSFWTGEPQAFEEFQSYFLEPKLDETSIINHALNAFRKTIENTQISTIGDFMITAYYNHEHNSFLYEEQLASYSGFEALRVKANEKKLLSEGTLEQGAFTVSNLISNRSGNQAVCLYFSKPKTAFLYLPISYTNSNIEPIIFRNVSRQELNDITTAKYGFELIGFNIENGKFDFK